MAVHVAIVEDEEIHQKTLKGYLERYSEEKGISCYYIFAP